MIFRYSGQPVHTLCAPPLLWWSEPGSALCHTMQPTHTTQTWIFHMLQAGRRMYFIGMSPAAQAKHRATQANLTATDLARGRCRDPEVSCKSLKLQLGLRLMLHLRMMIRLLHRLLHHHLHHQDCSAVQRDPSRQSLLRDPVFRFPQQTSQSLRPHVTCSRPFWQVCTGMVYQHVSGGACVHSCREHCAERCTGNLDRDIHES